MIAALPELRGFTPVTIDNVSQREWNTRRFLAGLGLGLTMAAGVKWL